MYARVYDCGQIVISTHDHDQHTRGTHDHRKKPAYIGIFAGNEKKYKKVKKNLEIRKNRRIFVAVIKQQTHRKGKRK